MVIAASVILLLAILLTPILLIRFRKRWVAAFNLAVTNRITSQFADRLPGFGILTHIGRKSGGQVLAETEDVKHNLHSAGDPQLVEDAE